MKTRLLTEIKIYRVLNCSVLYCNNLPQRGKMFIAPRFNVGFGVTIITRDTYLSALSRNMIGFLVPGALPLAVSTLPFRQTFSIIITQYITSFSSIQTPIFQRTLTNEVLCDTM